MTTKKLNEMRRALIMTAWQDYKIFGNQTEAVRLMARRISRAKSEMNDDRTMDN